MKNITERKDYLKREISSYERSISNLNEELEELENELLDLENGDTAFCETCIHFTQKRIQYFSRKQKDNCDRFPQHGIVYDCDKRHYDILVFNQKVDCNDFEFDDDTN